VTTAAITFAEVAEQVRALLATVATYTRHLPEPRRTWTLARRSMEFIG